ncbi:hypothetical protein AUC69_15205 [Methyloceanibacter superfactus]|uniref:Uncharacterized protein n=1 Tax=Methyloceanibacter superfactus TaxID=1774969 RepID=A0A1E3VRH0_9HYPH|nr:hypothetical protein [Methyloceanibacter superfactus]ODR96119.1 hypothetical protein AUC69_15205 [Methyloceanibacter superfactus]
MAETEYLAHNEIAAHLAVRNVPMFPGTLMGDEVRARLAGATYGAVDAVLVLDTDAAMRARPISRTCSPPPARPLCRP